MTDNETPGGTVGERGSSSAVPSGLGAVLGRPADVGTVVTDADNVTTRTETASMPGCFACAFKRLRDSGFTFDQSYALVVAGYDVLGYMPLTTFTGVQE